MLSLELPKIHFKNKTYVFDYKLNELRIITNKGLKSINLNNQELELLAYAIDNNNVRLIRLNMLDLEYKL